MSKTFVVVGCKTGDVIASLPIIYHEFLKSGQKPVVVIAKQYSHVLDRVPYAERFVYPGDWTDLAGALRMAKQNFNHVVCLSTYGRGFPIQHRTSSFVLDQYERAGVLPLWDTLPLVLSHSARSPFKTPTILFADHSQSSPFLQKQELDALLRTNFPEHQIIRLSDVLLPHIADFVGWYDQADALVTIETMHLHLSAATKTPTFALATDKPSRWHGSAQSKRFAFYCRYSEFDARKNELIGAMKDALAGVRKPEVICLN